MKPLNSRQNPKFRSWLSLLESKGIKKEKAALVSGPKIVDEFLKMSPGRVLAKLLPPKYEGSLLHPDSFQLSHELFSELDVIGTKAPLLVVQVDTAPEWQPEAPQGLEIVLALSDPGNLGAVLRSAEAFGVSKVILTKEAASPFLPRAIRASSGASFRIPMFRTESLKDVPTESAFALDMQGEDLRLIKWPKDVRLILGQEGQGLPDELSSATPVSIPMVGGESLNAMAAASIALFSYYSRSSSEPQ